MKKLLVVFLSLVCIGISAGFAADIFWQRQNNNEKERGMAYCTIEDLQNTYGADRITAWSGADGVRAEKAIEDASAEIDGYLLSGGYTVPLAGKPETIKKYCIDIASASLIISTGLLENDPGGKAVVDQAERARKYLDKVAMGKYKIPGYSNQDNEVSEPDKGNIQAACMTRMDWQGY